MKVSRDLPKLSLFVLSGHSMMKSIMAANDVIRDFKIRVFQLFSLSQSVSTREPVKGVCPNFFWSRRLPIQMGMLWFLNELNICFAFLPEDLWNFKKRWKSAKDGHVNNLKIWVSFSMFPNEFWKTNSVFWILHWQRQKNLPWDFISDVIFKK